MEFQNENLVATLLMDRPLLSVVGLVDEQNTAHLHV